MRSKPDHNLKAEKREIKKRPRMKMTGASLRRGSRHAGLAIIKSHKK